MSTEIPRTLIDGLRTSEPTKIHALVGDVLRHHIESIHPACVADLFALSELTLPTSLSADLRAWTSRACQELRDMPDNGTRGAWLDELGALSAEKVPARLRETVKGLLAGSGGAVVEQIEGLAVTWAGTPPEAIVLPKKRAAAKAAETTTRGADGMLVKLPKAAPKPRVAKVAKTPAAQVDPRRAEWVREDAVTRLNSSEYAERGLKESIFLGGIKHRSPFKDMTDEEIKVQLRKLEREGKVKHTGERWLAR